MYFCSGSAEKATSKRRADRLAPGRAVRRDRIGGSGFDVDDALQGPHLVEDLDPVVAAVADIEQPFAIELGAMRMAATDHRKEASIRPRVAPLPQELAFGVENHDAVVAVAVGDKDIAVVRIDRYVGGLVEKQRTPVAAGLAAFFIPIVTDALATDLKQQLFAVMRPFLHDPVSVAADPDVVLPVDKAPMDGFRHQFWIAPGVHHVPVGIIFDDDGRRLLADGLLHRREIRPVHPEDVIFSVHADAADGARHPAIRQRLRPIGVDDKARHVAVGRARGAKDSARDKQQRQRG